MNLKEIQKRHEADQKRFDNMSWLEVEQTEGDMHEDRAWLLDHIEELKAQLSANKETVRLLVDRWNGEAGEWLGADDCAYELKKALGSE